MIDSTATDISCRLSRSLRIALRHPTTGGDRFPHYFGSFHRISHILFGRASEPSPEQVEFAFDVFSYLLYEDAFLGLDLGSLHEAVVCSRYVSRQLRDKLRYVHSFHVLKHTVRAGTPAKFIVPIAEHPTNCPLFPSGNWTTAGDELVQTRLTAPWLAVEEFSRRIVARLSGSTETDLETRVFGVFQHAIASAGSFMGLFGKAGCKAVATACTSIAVQFTTASRNLSSDASTGEQSYMQFEGHLRGVRALSQTKYARRRLDEFASKRVGIWTQKIAKRSRQADVPVPDRDSLVTEIIRLFVVGVFERAAFQALQASSAGGVSPLEQVISYAEQNAFKAGNEADSEVAFFNAGRLLFQHLSPASDVPQNQIGSDREAQTLKPIVKILRGLLLEKSGSSECATNNGLFLRRRLLNDWMWGRITKDRDKLRKALHSDCKKAIARASAVCCCLYSNLDSFSTSTAINRFNEWDHQSFPVGADSPFRMLNQCRELFAGYAPALEVGSHETENASRNEPVGFSIAVHNLGATGASGAERVPVELFRIDVLTDTQRRLPDVREEELNAISLLDHVFMHAEQLIIAEETKRRLDAQGKEFNESMRKFTAEMAHEMRYEIDSLNPILDLPERVVTRCRTLLNSPLFNESNSDFRADTNNGLDAAELAGGLRELRFVLKLIGDGSKKGTDVASFIEDIREGNLGEFELKKVFSQRFSEIKNNLRRILETVLTTSNDRPESNFYEYATGSRSTVRRPVQCNPLKMLETFEKSVSRRGTLRGKRSVRFDFGDARLNRPIALPEYSFKHLILPELVRNAGNASRELVYFKASAKDCEGSPLLEILIRNDCKQQIPRRYGVGIGHVTRVLAANLGVAEEVVKKHYFTTNLKDDFFEARIRFPTVLYEEACERSYAK